MKMLMSGAALVALAFHGGQEYRGPGPLPRRMVEIEAKSTHLLHVVEELRGRKVAGLTAEQAARRKEVLDELAVYARRKRFIENVGFPYDMPWFIDQKGTRCAAAHLMDKTGYGELVLKLARTNNNAFVAELTDSEELAGWLEHVGMTVDEVAFIQGPGWEDPPPDPPPGQDPPPSTAPPVVRPGGTGGPGGVPTTGPPVGTPTTGGVRGAPTGPAAAARRRGAETNSITWRRWWELNREAFLHLRESYHEGRSVTGTPQQRAARRRPLQPSPSEIAQDILPVLQAALSDESEVSSTALVALARCKELGDVAALEEAVRSFLARTRDRNRDFGLLALGMLGTDPAQASLRAVLGDRGEGRSLLGSAGSLPERPRAMAAVALGRYGTAASVPLMWEVLREDKKSHIDLKSACVLALGLLSRDAALRPAIVPGLIQALKAGQWHERILAHIPSALAQSGDAAGLFAVAGPVLEFRGPREVRQSCALALGRMAPAWDADLQQALMDLARRDADAVGRQFAILSLGEMAHRAPQDSEGLSEQEEARRSLQAKFHRDALSGAFRQAADMPWHALAAGLFARRHEDHALALTRGLVHLLDSGNREDRAAALVGLGLVGSRGVEQSILAVFQETSDPLLQGYAAEALGMLRDQTSRDALTELVRTGGSDWVRYRAAGALALLADPHTMTAVVGSLEAGPSQPVQAALIRALGEIGDKRAVPALARLAQDPKREALSRARAVAALGLLAQRSDRSWSFDLRRAAHFGIATPTVQELQSLF